MMTKEQFIDDLFNRTIVVVDRNRNSNSIFFKMDKKIYIIYDIYIEKISHNYNIIEEQLEETINLSKVERLSLIKAAKKTIKAK